MSVGTRNIHLTERKTDPIGHDDYRTHLQVDAAGVAHERLAESDAPLLAADDAALEHQPVLVDLSKSSTVTRENKLEMLVMKQHSSVGKQRWMFFTTCPELNTNLGKGRATCSLHCK